MNIKTIWCVVGFVASFGLGQAVMGQATGASGGVQASPSDRAPQRILPDGVLRLNGVFYVVSGGVARRIELADGQIATLEGVIQRLPANFSLPTGGTTPAGTNGAPTGTTDRNRAVISPAPGATTPSVK